jgi:hypothetical protein
MNASGTTTANGVPTMIRAKEHMIRAMDVAANQAHSKMAFVFLAMPVQGEIARPLLPH